MGKTFRTARPIPADQRDAGLNIDREVKESSLRRLGKALKKFTHHRERRQKMDLIRTLLAHEAERNSVDEFRALVVGTLGSLVDGMSDSAFEQFCAVHRCDKIGCDCHVIAGEAARFFKLPRADVKKEFARRSCRRN